MIGVALAAIVLAAPAPPLGERLGSAQAATRSAAIAEALARPEAIDPFEHALLASALWRDGRRLQAAFWFYVFQVRSRPWADADRHGGGAAALRASLNDVLGTPINGWLGGDVATWRSVAARAMDYEARLPLGTARPDGVAADAWPALVAKARAAYRAGYEQTLGNADPVELAAQRRANGLPVGPLPDPGPPLPDTWR